MTHSWASFAALGDSFTEGVDDVGPDGQYRGWADAVARALDAQRPGLGYANLAVRGRLLPQIVAEQVPAAIQLRPELVSIVGGVNDMLRPTFDPAFLHRTLDRAVADLMAAGSEVVLLVGVNPTGRSRALTRLMPRVVALNELVHDVATRRGTRKVSLFDAGVFTDQRLWSPDRLHLSTLGHQRVAGAYLEALGVGDSSWREPLPPPVDGSAPTSALGQVRWVREHAGPWLARRLTGQSSGAEVSCRRPTLAPLSPAAHAESRS